MQYSELGNTDEDELPRLVLKPGAVHGDLQQAPREAFELRRRTVPRRPEPEVPEDHVGAPQVEPDGGPEVTPNLPVETVVNFVDLNMRARHTTYPWDLQIVEVKPGTREYRKNQEPVHTQENCEKLSPNPRYKVQLHQAYEAYERQAGPAAQCVS